MAAYAKLAQVPIQFNWTDFVLAYWIDIASSAIFAAALLYVVQRPETLKTCWHRYCAQPSRFLVIGIASLWLMWRLEVITGLKLTVVAIVVAEFFDVLKYELPRVSQSLRNFLLPAAYFFFGVVFVLAYNALILSVSPTLHDETLLKADHWFLAGSSVSELSRVASVTLPSFVFTIFDWLYLAMFNEIGAALVLVAFMRGYKEGCRYVGTLLTAYYIALLIFYLYPTLSPYYLCTDHLSHLPATNASIIQRIFVARMPALRSAFALNVQADYNIAFPCMHIALAVIAWWFCREWKRIARLLFVYNLALIPSILLLEWHYVVDVIGGIAVAFLAIAITRIRLFETSPAVSASEPSYAPGHSSSFRIRNRNRQASGERKTLHVR
jgi:PAP2 superfamily